MFGTERWCVGVLVCGSGLGDADGAICSDMSDSEKLRVLDRDEANFLTELTISTSLP